MAANICCADASFSSTHGLEPLRVRITINTVLQMLIIIQESSLMPEMAPWPLPRKQMNKDSRRTPAVHEMQLFSAATGLYVTVLQKHHSQLADACSAGKHLVIKESREKMFP